MMFCKFFHKHLCTQNPRIIIILWQIKFLQVSKMVMKDISSKTMTLLIVNIN